MPNTGFTLDPAATDQNHKCPIYFTIQQNGLLQSWQDHIVFVNPPYSAVGEWVEKAFNEAKKNFTHVVMLLPVRTDTKWFHQFVMQANKIIFIKGRLKFGNAKNSAPFPSMIVEFRPTWNANGPEIAAITNKP
jgi:phage N-6-adenine-methyltransferase